MAPLTSGKQMFWIGRRRVGMPFFMDLPQELVDAIYDHFINRDIKNARLAGRAFREVLILRFPRVFISPNTRDLNVFCAVVQREELRKQVVEVIWDDARFEEQVFDEKFQKTLQENEEMLSKLDPDERKQRYEKFWGMEANMTPIECFDRYKQFYKDQQKAIKTGSDSGAFRSGLAWFPNLRNSQAILFIPSIHDSYDPFIPTGVQLSSAMALGWTGRCQA